ncbi:cell wall-binding protein [Enterobacter hormaechei]|uniref:cell wall-binding protein n=1 Tax=Enterobacter hormaechei TaxID=158836 RepID=UPI002021DD22|nr:cell wall-binding protein [Enterobacter hormaechei]MCL8125284.1 cell wall-binding protein [Enterobacter hormaechei]MCM7010110.1 cell wall-binding protein [Enterobacter hormaechei]
MKTYSILAVILSTFLLTACNSEPSEKDIFNVFKSVVDRSNASMKALNSSIPEKDLLRIDYVKKVSCTEVTCPHD